jgi:hypothetical protein
VGAELDILFLGAAELARLELAPAELIDAVENVVRAQGTGEVALEPRVHRLDGRPRERAVRPGVEVRVPLEHRELCAGVLERHSTLSSTGA